MDADTILFKTALGSEEVKGRLRSLPAKLRSVLIMVDGTDSYGEMLKKTRQLEFLETSLQQLISLGFITDGKDITDFTMILSDDDWDSEYCRKLKLLLQNLSNELLGDKGLRVTRKIGATSEDRDSIVEACRECKVFVQRFVGQATAIQLGAKYSEVLNLEI